MFSALLSSPLEKEIATHSSVLAWRIPGTVEPDGLSSMGSHRVGHVFLWGGRGIDLVFSAPSECTNIPGSRFYFPGALPLGPGNLSH